MISAIVLTKNQEEVLRVCLESIKWCDEIIVIDDNSGSETMAIARQYTDKIYVNPMVDFASQRNFAMTQTKADWVLFIDPDERVTKELRDEILSVARNPDTSAAAIPRRNFYLGCEQKQLGAWPDFVIRLLKKSSFETWQGLLHEQPKFSGNLVYCKNPFIHLTHTDITSMTKKTLSWSHLEAELRLNSNHPQMSSWRFFRICVTTFFDWYIRKGGFRAGTTGTIEAIFQTFSVFITYVRLWEMQRKTSLSDTYAAIDRDLLATDFADLS